MKVSKKNERYNKKTDFIVDRKSLLYIVNQPPKPSPRGLELAPVLQEDKQPKLRRKKYEKTLEKSSRLVVDVPSFYRL